VYLIVATISTAFLSIFISALWPNIIYAIVKISRGGKKPRGRVPSPRRPIVWIGFWVFLFITTISATLAGRAPKTADNNYIQIDLSPWANWADLNAYALIKPLTGTVILDGIPFYVPMPEEGVIQTQQHTLINEATTITIPTDIAYPQYIYILLNGAYVRSEFHGIPVGILSLTFSDGTIVRSPIIVGQCLREGWHYTDDATNDMVTNIDDTGICKNVFAEFQTRGSHTAVAVIDKITLPIPESVVSLTQIRIEDTSVDTVNSFDPSIIIIAITVQKK